MRWAASELERRGPVIAGRREHVVSLIPRTRKEEVWVTRDSDERKGCEDAFNGSLDLLNEYGSPWGIEERTP